ncbi:MAG: type I methionyl aminopeptidase [Bdellovibrionota bacterium]
MILIKTPQEIEGIKKSSLLAYKVLEFIEPYIQVGISTDELDKLCYDFIIAAGATPSPLNYKGYPKSICTSINQVVCHGIPDSTKLREGDIIKVDISTYLEGYHGDTCRTYPVGKVSRAARDLMKATEESLYIGIEQVKPGGHFGDIGAAIQNFIESKGYSVVKEYGGHGIGKSFHEDPHVAHVGKKGTGPEFKEGMVFTIEPMINQGKASIILLDDDWTVETEDGKLSAQYEHTLAVTHNGCEILTKED